MHHPGEANVLHICRTTRHFGRNITPRHRAADDRLPRLRLRRHRCTDFAVEIEPGRELAIAELAAIGTGDDALTHVELFCSQT